MKQIIILSFLLFLIIFSSEAQTTINFPRQLPSPLTKMGNKKSKKIFLVYNFNTQAQAEAIFNGARFVAGDLFTCIPVYILPPKTNQKTSLEFPNCPPIQSIQSIESTDYKTLNIKESDLPLLIIYNEKNEFCGFSKDVSQLTDQECLAIAPSNGK